MALWNEFATIEARELFAQMIENVDQPRESQSATEFLGAFVRHQPQYRPEACVIASGFIAHGVGHRRLSLRHHQRGDPRSELVVRAVFSECSRGAADSDVGTRCQGLIAKIEELCVIDPSWPQHGAGGRQQSAQRHGRIFAEEVVRKLITYCLERGIYVVDDLAYQNVAPVDDLPVIKTARQHARRSGARRRLMEEQADRVLTVHSMSKTDCLAGARLQWLKSAMRNCASVSRR